MTVLAYKRGRRGVGLRRKIEVSSILLYFSYLKIKQSMLNIVISKRGLWVFLISFFLYFKIFSVWKNE